MEIESNSKHISNPILNPNPKTKSITKPDPEQLKIDTQEEKLKKE